MTCTLIRRTFSAYESLPEDSAITLRLDRTEPPISYREVTADCVESVLWSRYPSAISLEAKIARRVQVKPKNVIVTAGADEALDRACRAILANGDALLTTAPTFEMIEKYGILAGSTVNEVPWLDGEFPMDEFRKRISEHTRLIVLVNPNNPTGQCIPVGAIERIASENPNLLLLLDLAYVEFAEFDPTRELLRFPNIVMVRSFSKAWGFPGLRLGYAVGNAAIIQAMRAAGGPYSVAAASIEMIEKNLERFEPAMQEYVTLIKYERNNLEQWLTGNGIRFIPSQSNFILLFPEHDRDFDRALRTFGIRTRSFNNSDMPNARRLTLPGNAEAFALLLIAFEEAFQLQTIPL